MMTDLVVRPRRWRMARTVRLSGKRLSEELERLEREHHMPSSAFLEKYQAGEMGDSKDMVRWAWLCSVALRNGMLKPTVPA
jgi:hypothetical protein